MVGESVAIDDTILWPSPFVWRRSVASTKLLVPLAAAVLVLAGCGEDPPTGAGEAEAQPTMAEPTDPLLPMEEGVEGPMAAADCVNGWTVPDDPEQRELPFHVIRRTMQVDGEFEIVEMRYFEGPESPPSDKGYAQRIDRWYVKAHLKSDPRFRGRWLIEERTYGSGVAAVAPWGSEGFESPDWVGFQYEGAGAERRRYPGLPGKWAGTPYDFVTGEGAFDFPGLPAAVRGCLAGT